MKDVMDTEMQELLELLTKADNALNRLFNTKEGDNEELPNNL